MEDSDRYGRISLLCSCIESSENGIRRAEALQKDISRENKERERERALFRWAIEIDFLLTQVDGNPKFFFSAATGVQMPDIKSVKREVDFILTGLTDETSEK